MYIFEGFHTDIACNRLSFENWQQAYYDVDVLTHTQEGPLNTQYVGCILIYLRKVPWALQIRAICAVLFAEY